MALNSVYKLNTSLVTAFSQASSILSANVSVSPRTLCLQDERNARKNCEVKSLRLVFEQPLTSIFPCVDSIHFILSALNSAHDSPPESAHASLTNVSDGKLSLHTSLCLYTIICTIVLLVHDGAFALRLAFRRGKKAKTHTKQAPLPPYKTHATPRTLPFVFFGRSGPPA